MVPTSVTRATFLMTDEAAADVLALAAADEVAADVLALALVLVVLVLAEAVSAVELVALVVVLLDAQATMPTTRTIASTRARIFFICVPPYKLYLLGGIFAAIAL
jgi:hypothetical protein